jgi:hypothetical protein
VVSLIAKADLGGLDGMLDLAGSRGNTGIGQVARDNDIKVSGLALMQATAKWE